MCDRESKSSHCDGLRLSGEQKRRLGQPRTENAEAYQRYLQGRYHWNKRSAESLKRSIKLFEQAIDLGPTYALAYCGVADAYLNLGGWGQLPFREAYPRARAAATQALAMDENLAEAYVSLAMVLKEYDWDYQGAGGEYQRALELNPNYAVANRSLHAPREVCLRRMGFGDEARCTCSSRG
jgi:tetratricopeptide (TPR) repeat protein